MKYWRWLLFGASLLQACIGVGFVCFARPSHEGQVVLLFFGATIIALPGLGGLVVAGRPQLWFSVGTPTAVIDGCIALMAAFWLLVYMANWAAEGFAVPAMGLGTFLWHVATLYGYLMVFSVGAVSAIMVACKVAREGSRQEADQQKVEWLALANGREAKPRSKAETRIGSRNEAKRPARGPRKPAATDIQNGM